MEKHHVKNLRPPNSIPAAIAANFDLVWVVKKKKKKKKKKKEKERKKKIFSL